MTSVDLLVLDAHGVVFNNPWRPFLRELALRTGQEPDTVLARWDRELRLRAWTGHLDDEGLFGRLAGGRAPHADWRAQLEARYTLGPAAPFLDRWRARVPIWLLSNHRSHWLFPRLDRFGLAGKFDRVLVSDELRAAKPSVRAFAPLLDAHYARGRVLFVDDQDRNVRSARELGLRAVRLTEDVARVDALLGSPKAPSAPLR